MVSSQSPLWRLLCHLWGIVTARVHHALSSSAGQSQQNQPLSPLCFSRLCKEAISFVLCFGDSPNQSPTHRHHLCHLCYLLSLNCKLRLWLLEQPIFTSQLSQSLIILQWPPRFFAPSSSIEGAVTFSSTTSVVVSFTSVCGCCPQFLCACSEFLNGLTYHVPLSGDLFSTSGGPPLISLCQKVVIFFFWRTQK